MKIVEAIVKPSKLNEVKEALTKAGVQGMSDHGLQPGQFLSACTRTRVSMLDDLNA